MVARVITVNQKLPQVAVLWDVTPCSLIGAQTFRKNLLHPSPSLKEQTTRSSETTVLSDELILRHTPGDRKLDTRHCEHFEYCHV